MLAQIIGIENRLKMTQKFEAITNLKVAQRKESPPNGEIVGARKRNGRDQVSDSHTLSF